MRHKTAKDLDNFIRESREEFRANATDALEMFPNDDRELAASMETKHTSADKVLKAWEEQIEPMYRELEGKRSDARLKKSLITHLGFRDNDATKAIDRMVRQRKQSLLDEVLDNLYHSDIEEPPYQREYAVNLLSQTSNEINDFYERYLNYVGAIEAAERHDIVLCDPHSSWLERQRTAMAINKERQMLAEDENARLQEIDNELRKLLSKDALLGHIIAKKLSVIALLDLAATYQKRLKDMKKKDRDDPTARLKLFERVSARFLEGEVERIAKSHSSHTLRSLSGIQSSISNLLLEIFDLSSTQRNRLLLDTQRHTRLIQEQKLIRLIQHNRTHFFNSQE